MSLLPDLVSHLVNESASLDDAEPEVRATARQLHHSRSLQPNSSIVQTFKQPLTAAEEHWHYIDLKFIRKSIRKALQSRVSAADDLYFPLARSRFGLTNRTGNPIRHKSKS